MKLKRFKHIVLVIGALAVVFAPQAFATLGAPSLFISDNLGCTATGLGTVTGCGGADYIMINGDGTISATGGTVRGLAFAGTPSVSGGGGAVSFAGSLGTVWNAHISFGTAPPATTFPTLMDLTDSSTSGGAGSTSGVGDLLIEFTALGYPAENGFQVSAGGTLATGGTYTDKAYFSTANTAFALTTQIGSTLTFTAPPTAFSGTVNSSQTMTGGSITEVMTLHHSAAGTSSNDQVLMSGVPEPASVALLGGVLLLTFKALRRKQRA